VAFWTCVALASSGILEGCTHAAICIAAGDRSAADYGRRVQEATLVVVGSLSTELLSLTGRSDWKKMAWTARAPTMLERRYQAEWWPLFGT